RLLRNRVIRQVPLGSRSRTRAPPTGAHQEAAGGDAMTHAISVELDAIDPNNLRTLVTETIEQYLPQHQLEVLKAAEESERDIITRVHKEKRARKGARR